MPSLSSSIPIILDGPVAQWAATLLSESKAVGSIPTTGESEDKNTVLWTLYGVVLETPNVVRNIHDDRYKAVVLELVKNFQNALEMSLQEKIIYATILLLKSEYDMAEASQNCGWKVTEHTTDPDQDRTVRTMQQEYEAIGSALQAVQLYSDVVRGFET
ncbi:jg412, partial [Pararge aegeria aegeria]